MQMIIISIKRFVWMSVIDIVYAKKDFDSFFAWFASLFVFNKGQFQGPPLILNI